MRLIKMVCEFMFVKFQFYILITFFLFCSCNDVQNDVKVLCDFSGESVA